MISGIIGGKIEMEIESLVDLTMIWTLEKIIQTLEVQLEETIEDPMDKIMISEAMIEEVMVSEDLIEEIRREITIPEEIRREIMISEEIRKGTMISEDQIEEVIKILEETKREITILEDPIEELIEVMGISEEDRRDQHIEDLIEEIRKEITISEETRKEIMISEDRIKEDLTKEDLIEEIRKEITISEEMIMEVIKISEEGSNQILGVTTEVIRKEIIKRRTIRIMISGDQIEEDKKMTIEDERGVDSLEVPTRAIIIIVGQITREEMIEGRIKGLEKEIVRKMEAIRIETIEHKVTQEVMVETLGLMIEAT